MARGTYRRWTADELQYLKEHFPTDENADIAKAIGRTVYSVGMKAFKLGLLKSHAFVGAKMSIIGKEKWQDKSEEERAQWRANIGDGKRRAYDAERRRVLFGLPQKTKHVIHLSGRAKRYYRIHLRYKFGYICPLDEPGAAYYGEDTCRSAKAEKYGAEKYGIKFLPIEDKNDRQR